jgi:ribosome biogenesis protein Tsr3
MERARNARLAQGHNVVSISSHQPLSGPEKLILVGLVGIAIGAFGVEQTHTGQKELIALVFVVLPLVVAGAGLVLAHARWLPAVAAVVAALYLIGALTTAGELSNLTHVAATWLFAAITLELLSCALVLLAGVSAIVQHNGRRQGPRP